jgi:hypothetical protein
MIDAGPSEISLVILCLVFNFLKGCKSACGTTRLQSTLFARDNIVDA